MLLRLVTGILLAILVVLGILFLPASAVKAVVSILAGFGAYECARMILPKDPSSSIALPSVLALGLSLLILFYPEKQFLGTVVVPGIILFTFIFYLFRKNPLTLTLSQISRSVLTVFYLGFLFSFVGLLRELPEGAGWLLLVLATTFAADTGAYFSGRAIGKHRLAPHVSPGKTVEGLVGGLVLSIVAAFIVKYLIYKELSIIDCLGVGAIAGLIGPMGDLAESLLKRSVGVKDSGKLIPGHGGLLDRVDALLFTAPLVYWYAIYLR